MLDNPQIIQAAETDIAIIHLTIPRSQMREVMGPGISELMAVVKTQGIGPTGAWFTHHLRFEPGTFDFEICVPVNAPVVATGRVRPGIWRAMKLARATLQGGYENLAAAWPELDAWIKAGGHTPAVDLYECYVAGPESSPDPKNWRTELSRPLID